MDDRELIAALILLIAHMLGDTDINNAEYAKLIDLWVRSERGRMVLKRSMIDDIPVEQIAVEIDRSPRQTSRILQRARSELQKHI